VVLVMVVVSGGDVGPSHAWVLRIMCVRGGGGCGGDCQYGRGCSDCHYGRGGDRV